MRAGRAVFGVAQRGKLDCHRLALDRCDHGIDSPLVDEIHTLRGHPGQINVARSMRALMDGSEIRESHREGDTRVQDPIAFAASRR